MTGFIEVVEAAYRLDDDDDVWLSRLGSAIGEMIDDGLGLIAWMFDPTRAPDDWLFSPVAVGADAGLCEAILGTHRQMPQADRETIYLYSPGIGTSSQLLGAPAADTYDPVRPFAIRYGFRDFLGVRCLDAGVGGCVFGAPLRTPRRVNRAFMANWGRVSAHVAAGMRLRRALGTKRAGARSDEAVVDLRGKVHHAEGEANTPAALRALRDEARNIDRARGKHGRADPASAVRVWKALVAGRWSLVDRFDADGRHFLVAKRNEPDARDPRALSRGERVVARYLAAGHSNKLIAYTLGVSDGTVSALAAAVFRKLGVRSRVALIGLLSDPGTGRATELGIGEDRLVVHSREEARPERLGALTAAENDVARLIVSGKTNAEIAERRGCAPRTVAVHAASIYAKLRVKSRAELAALLATVGRSTRA